MANADAQKSLAAKSKKVAEAARTSSVAIIAGSHCLARQNVCGQQAFATHSDHNTARWVCVVGNHLPVSAVFAKKIDTAHHSRHLSRSLASRHLRHIVDNSHSVAVRYATSGQFSIARRACPAPPNPDRSVSI